MYHRTIFKNGLRILTSYMPHTHSVCIAFFIGVGSRYESEKEAGISHFIEHVSFRGTTNRPSSREISEAIEGVGGILNGATDKELTFYWCKVASQHFTNAAGVLVDMLLNSKFDPADIEKERQVIIEEIHMCKDSPSQQAGMLIDELLWSSHPLGRDIAGTENSVMALNRSDLLKFIRSKYSPQNTLIAVTGNIKESIILPTIEKLLGNWANTAPLPVYQKYDENNSPRLKIEKRDTEQVHLCLALPGISLLHPQRFHLDLLNVILGEGMSSRLFTEIRDKMGLAYGVSSYVEHFLDSGALTVAASVAPFNLNKSVEAIIHQLELLKDEIPEAEIIKAREISKGRLMLRMEDSRNVAGWLGGQEMLTGRILSVEEVVKIINGIKASDLQQIAREIIQIEKLRLAVVGPVKRATALKKILKIDIN